MDYKGVTFKWKGNYIGTIIRLGPYRDTDPSLKRLSTSVYSL